MAPTYSVFFNMHIAADLKVIAFLSALLIPALGALTTEQITVGLQDLTDDINDVNDYAESLTVLDADLDTDVCHAQSTPPAPAVSQFLICAW